MMRIPVLHQMEPDGLRVITSINRSNGASRSAYPAPSSYSGTDAPVVAVANRSSDRQARFEVQRAPAGTRDRWRCSDDDHQRALP